MKLVRLATVLAAVLAFAAVSTSASAQTQPPPKVQVCHKAANGTFHLITISTNATDAHMAHGDGLPGQAVPNMDGFIFGENCAPTVAPPPEMPVGCYAVPSQEADLFYAGPIDTLGNFSAFFDGGNGTCSGDANTSSTEGIIAAANETDAQSKCQSLGGPTSRVAIVDLGAPGVLVPSEPGFWLCSVIQM